MNREEFARHFDVSRETMARLDCYAERLTKWNGAINLVAASTLDDIWTRHFADSAQLLTHAPGSPRTWIDLGSGAGFPGLVVAIMRPEIEVTLVESDARKAVFLDDVNRTSGAGATILRRRIEDVEAQAEVVSARALAPLPKLLDLTERLLLPGGHALFLKGISVQEELTEANRLWHIAHTRYDSIADPRGSILSISNFHRRTGI